MGETVRVLVLEDYGKDPHFISQTEYFRDAMEVIRKLREPHNRFYEFRSVCFEHIEKWEDELAWYEVNTTRVPNSFDLNRGKFLQAFDLLWERGIEVFRNV